MDLIRQAWQFVVDPYYTRYLGPLQLAGDALLCGLVIRYIPYTEIDWKTYMQQISLYISGERDYARITGDTGPLVYPAAHVYIYRALYYLTDAGQEVQLAQYLFAALYLLTLGVVISCYRRAGAPPYLLPLLSLSKRVHSIFVLRLFNDCFAVLFLWVAIWCYQRRFWTFGSLAYSLGLGVKMSVLLALPAVGLVLWQGMGRDRAFYQAQSIGQLQTLLAYPFIVGGLKSYVTRAFEFTRTFMFKWTVNWRFLGEERFLGRPFSLLLIAAHLTLLYTFGVGRWLKPSGWSLSEAIDKFLSPPPKGKEEEGRISRRVTPDFVMTSILTAIIIGCLCARSLHYQFFVYIAWSTPFLLWRSGMHPILIYAICIVQEWAWNVYPSTNTSSLVVVHCLGAAVFSIWVGTSPLLAPKANESQADDQSKHEHAE
ncbi:Dol-P-Man:Man(5) c(2)-PP-Dol alpha-1,3-mannosyltransferase [Lecanosticta acicola]|uniref:Dol-P-Man:Man(5)GlcNAc(2)-PP-Dol alpha-1,3-mannosyltransferase n=1 Tax=Lecanosticta acicola TaxID=111012 RepID=A0AAI8Z0Z1_9PEZI|nr:Dol-P-Man:Man(5) c(2)-PP-Dol alpha-1,3-mannosyltransferase [Lecanosticta acicola]